ncbi:acyl-CoA dehydrogenase family protein [Jiangella asiatica]|uniref:Acyl-CoA dehydrogenase n=1 Tax=Jiangella asiatica TaxID=2530372 RepID=A0A4R5DDE7_9ACTN|nr:acyl-CoA dehydrogenase family protein [Jiangella asiatica]TDE11826.1 acyl-CoA dehydrogenase [Jiangella asiatica]
MDFELSEERAEIRQTVRQLCAKFPDSYWRELDQKRAYPEEFLRTMLDSGWLGVLIPTEYGGKGMGMTEAAIIIEEISRSGGNAISCHAQIYNVAMLMRHASEEQKRRYLPRIAAGELRFLAFGLTEHNAGQNTTRLETSAVRDGDHYVVNGSKNWLSRIQHSDLLLLIARTTPFEQAARKTEGITAFLVELPVEGIHVTPVPLMMNIETNEVTFDDVRIPASSMVGEEGKAFRYILDGVNGDRIAAASAAIGDARWFVDKARDYANERVVFDQPIGKNQAVQFPIARAYANTEAASLMRFKAATLYDAGRPCGPESNMAKLFASEASWGAAEAAMSTYGGYAFAASRDIERKFRETRLFLNAPGSNNLILSYLGQHVLGMPRSF